MKRAISFAILISLLYGAAGNAAIAPKETVGWFFDEAATQGCYAAQPYVPVTAYLCLRAPSTVACNAWELKTTLSGNVAVLQWLIRGGGLNVLNPPEFAVGLAGTGVTPNQFGVIVLASATIMPLDANEVTFRVEPTSTPSLPGLMAFVRSGDPTLRAMVSSSGSAQVPTSWLNADGWPCASLNGGQAGSVHVKTIPGIVDISNPAGGDFAGNVVFKDAPMESLVTAFEVIEVSKLKGAWPDTVDYTVRVTGEMRTSYSARDLFRFVVSDSSDVAALVEAMEELNCVEWASRIIAPQSFGGRGESFPNDPCLGRHIANPDGPDADFLHAWFMIDSLPARDRVRVSVVDPIAA